MRAASLTEEEEDEEDPSAEHDDDMIDSVGWWCEWSGGIREEEY